MQTVNPGNTITFSREFYDSNGDPYDPAEITFRVAKNATSFLAGPFSLSNGDITQTVIGTYQYTYQVTEFVTPGIFNARWEANIEGVDSVFLESFQVLEPIPEPNSILDVPRRYGVMIESSLYKVLGVGETDRLFLVGHADGLALNDPYQVRDMQEAVNVLGAHSESPMIRALLEAYNMGARDIWIVAAAPEGEYVPFDFQDPDSRLQSHSEWGGLNFYERYYERLIDTYSLLRQYDYPEIIVPIDAPAYDSGSVDFVQQLVDHCLDAYEATGLPRIGIIGTRMGDFSADKVQSLIDDAKFDVDYGTGGKFVMIAHGEASFNLSQLGVSHVGQIAASVGALLSRSQLNTGITYKLITNAIAPYGRELTKAEYSEMARRKINPLIRTAKGRRGTQNQLVLASDNTLASDGSDYWSVVQMRLVSKVIQEIRTLGLRYLGTIGFMQFRSDVADYMTSLVMGDQIRDYQLKIERDQTDIYRANVDISISPYYGVRELAFQIQVGPGA